LILALPAAIALHWLISPVTDILLTLLAKIYYSVASPSISCSYEGRNFLVIPRTHSFEASISLRDLTVNQPLLWALIGVTPGILLLNRLKKLLLGTGMIILSHLVFLIGKVEIILLEAGYREAGSQAFWQAFDNFLEMTGKGFLPLAIWLTLTLPYMMGELDRRDSIQSGDLSRNDPCPCGSGKKYKLCCMP